MYIYIYTYIHTQIYIEVVNGIYEPIKKYLAGTYNIVDEFDLILSSC